MALTSDLEEELILIIHAVDTAPEIRGKSRDFFNETKARYQEHGANIHLSAKQWQWLRDLYRQATT